MTNTPAPRKSRHLHVLHKGHDVAYLLDGRGRQSRSVIAFDLGFLRLRDTELLPQHHDFEREATSGVKQGIEPSKKQTHNESEHADSLHGAVVIPTGVSLSADFAKGSNFWRLITCRPFNGISMSSRPHLPGRSW